MLTPLGQLEYCKIATNVSHIFKLVLFLASKIGLSFGTREKSCSCSLVMLRYHTQYCQSFSETIKGLESLYSYLSTNHRDA